MSRFERILLALGASGTFLTGLLFGWMKYLMSTDDPFAVVNHPWQPVVLKLHILFAPVLVFAIGLVFTQHIWRQWRSPHRAGRASGFVTMLTVAPMVFTGYLIQAIPGGSLLTWAVWAHIVTGSVYFGMYAGHHVSMRWRARRRRDAADERLRVAGRARDEDAA